MHVRVCMCASVLSIHSYVSHDSFSRISLLNRTHTHARAHTHTHTHTHTHAHTHTRKDLMPTSRAGVRRFLYVRSVCNGVCLSCPMDMTNHISPAGCPLRHLYSEGGERERRDGGGGLGSVTRENIFEEMNAVCVQIMRNSPA